MNEYRSSIYRLITLEAYSYRILLVTVHMQLLLPMCGWVILTRLHALNLFLFCFMPTLVKLQCIILIIGKVLHVTG